MEIMKDIEGQTSELKNDQGRKSVKFYFNEKKNNFAIFGKKKFILILCKNGVL